MPYEFTWLAILWLPDTLRKLLKLNAEALSLILRELDFWVPFVTMCISAISGAASFGYDGTAVQFFIFWLFYCTVNILMGESAHSMHSHGD